MQQQGLELKSQVERHESRIQFNEDRMRDLAAQNARAAGEIAQAEERRLAARQELDEVAQRWPPPAPPCNPIRRPWRRSGRPCRAWKTSCAPTRRLCARPRPESFEAAQQLSRARNEINALDLQKEGNAVRLEKLSAEKVQLEEERTGLAGAAAAIFRQRRGGDIKRANAIAARWRNASSACAKFNSN